MSNEFNGSLSDDHRCRPMTPDRSPLLSLTSNVRMVSWSTTQCSREQPTNKGNASRSYYMRSPTLAQPDATTIPYCKVTDWERMQNSTQNRCNSLMLNLAEVGSMVLLIGVINALLPCFVCLAIFFCMFKRLKPNENRRSASVAH